MIVGDFVGTALAITAVDPLANAAGGTLAATVVDSDRVTVVLPDPSPEDLVEIPQFPGVELGTFAVGLFADDGDAEAEAGEPWVGLGQDVLIYLQAGDGLPAQLKQVGFAQGWNVVGDAYFASQDLVNLPVERAVASDRATIAGSGKAAGRRVAFLPPGFLDADRYEPLIDKPLEDTFTLVGEGKPPPKDHTVDGVDPTVHDGSAYELGLTYVDEDASGSFTSGDGRSDRLGYCLGGYGSFDVGFAWVTQSDSLVATLAHDGQWGWQVVGWDRADPSAPPVWLGPELSDVVVGDCP